MLDPGDVIERYEVVRVLGEGGMAKVVLVRHTTLGTLHALKVLTLTGPTLKERLVEEGRAQAVLRHENIVRVSDVLEVQGMPALLMDFVDGPDLAAWIREEHPTPTEAEAVFRGVVAGVAAAHRAGRVHRDLKPANVLLARDGERLIPKVADFGLVKAIHGDGASSSFSTRAGMAMGTPRYMAPEQFRDAAGVDERADVFSLGGVLYELLAYRPPVDGEDLFEILQAAEQGRREPLPAGTPERLRRVVDACLQPRPQDRPADCAAVLRLLDGEAASLVSEPSQPTMGVTLAPRPPASIQKKPAGPAPAVWVAWAAAGALVVTAAGLVVLMAAAVFWWSRSGDPDGPCPRTGGDLGVARVVGPGPRRQRWVVGEETAVLEHLPTDGEAVPVVCRLTVGTVLEGVDEPIRSGGERWVKVVAEQIAAEPGVPAPSGPGVPCEGEPGERLGWFRARPRAVIGPFPTVGRVWRPDPGREVVAFPPDAEHQGEEAPVVCVVPEGAAIDIVEPPVRQGKDYWIPYVVPTPPTP